MIMGSNMAECHPVAFRWVMQAKTRAENPCTVIHVDPRFTRTSAMADIYAPLRAGSDIVLLGGLIKYVLDRHEPIFRRPASALTPRERFFRDYIVHYTNAATLITKEYQGTDEDEVSGLFAGFDEAGRKYDTSKWRYDREDGLPEPPGADAQFAGHVRSLVQRPAKTDPTLQDPRCVFQILRRHFQRYVPELVQEVCGAQERQKSATAYLRRRTKTIKIPINSAGWRSFLPLGLQR